MTFEQWLLANNYSPSTVRKALGDLQRAGQSQDPNIVLNFRRYMTYAAEHPQHADVRLVEVGQDQGVEQVTRLPKARPAGRKLEARSFDETAWNSLRTAVEGSAVPEDQVIWAMATTARRVGDVLRVERKMLVEGLANGVLMTPVKGGRIKPLPLGVPAPWEALLLGMKRSKPPAVNVADYVTGGDSNPLAGGAAYHRVRRRLRALCAALQTKGRANTHRIRRTVAVTALETTENTVAVQQMLGHSSLGSTLQYVDEVNENKTRALQKQLAGKRKR